MIFIFKEDNSLILSLVWKDFFKHKTIGGSFEIKNTGLGVCKNSIFLNLKKYYRHIGRNLEGNALKMLL